MVAAIAAGLLVVALAVTGFLTARGDEPATPASISATVENAAIPDRAWQTLEYIDAGDWPDAADAPGTRGGQSWQNRDGDLPRKDGSGATITYQEWDVNPKKRGQSRDAERIVTGSDGSAWYTGDHYETFERMR